MPHRDDGAPPDKERAAPHHQDDPNRHQHADSPAATRQVQGNRPRAFARPATPKSLPRICPTDIPGQLRARRLAAQRSVPLHCGHRDPWVCGCYTTEPPLSENMIDAGRSAALHILDTGKVPLLEIEVLRALYRRGGADRTLAERLHQLTGGVVR
jgi:hypothetical protein